MCALNAAQVTRPAGVQKITSKPVRALSSGELHLLQATLNSQPLKNIKVDRLKILLSDYQVDLARYLIQGFTTGFSNPFLCRKFPFESPNLKSALANPKAVALKLTKELEAGRIVGPFSCPPLPSFHFSPLCIVPKKDPSEFRLIHHLSYPRGSSVNDFIPEEFSCVHYATINNAIAIIKRIGAGCFLAKTDIKSAFRIIPIHPNDYNLLEMKWDDKYYFERCLPMGCSTSRSIFEAFSSALEWVSTHRLNASAVLHILDDLLFIAPTRAQCAADLANFLRLCEHIRVPIAHEKTVGPETTLQFAGITLDSLNMDTRLPIEKLKNCNTLISQFYRKRTVTLKELQSALTQGSRRLHQRAWRVLIQFSGRFCGSPIPQLPLDPATTALFVSYLSACNLVHSTITSYLSALGYIHKLKGFPDPTKTLLIRKLLTAQNRKSSADIRLPITQPVLHELVRSLRHTNSSAYQRSLYSAIFKTAFYVFFLVSLKSRPRARVSRILLSSSVNYISLQGMTEYREQSSPSLTSSITQLIDRLIL